MADGSSGIKGGNSDPTLVSTGDGEQSAVGPTDTGEIASRTQTEVEALRSSLTSRMGEMATKATMLSFATRAREAAQANLEAARAVVETGQNTLGAAENSQHRATELKEAFIREVKKGILEIYNQNGALSSNDIRMWLRVTLAADITEEWQANRVIEDRIFTIEQIADYAGELMVVDPTDSPTNKPVIYEIEQDGGQSAPEFKFISNSRVRLKLNDSKGQEALVPILGADLSESVIKGKDKIDRWLSQKLIEVETDLNNSYSEFAGNIPATLDLILTMDGRFEDEVDVMRLGVVKERIATAIATAIRKGGENIQTYVGWLRKMPEQWKAFEDDTARTLAVNIYGQPGTANEAFLVYFFKYISAVIKEETKDQNRQDVNMTAEFMAAQEKYLLRGKSLLEREATGNA